MPRHTLLLLEEETGYSLEMLSFLMKYEK